MPNNSIHEDRFLRVSDCHACGQHTMNESVSKEWCTNCGAACDYWGSGANAEYKAGMERRYARERGDDS